MKFESKKQMAKKLIEGKRFKDHSGIEIYYDESFDNPFRYGTDGELHGIIWNEYNKNIWIEIKPRHKHQDLIDIYQEGQAWQFTRPSLGNVYIDHKDDKEGTWTKPDWFEYNTYRLHPHNDLIQEHLKGAKIQIYRDGEWADMLFEPIWSENHQYRIKPST
jgi:hypothetical protein